MLAEVEDDYHCMAVEIRHCEGIARDVESRVHRAPWTTCPGAEQTLTATFAGVALGDFVARGQKKANCTHLHDLALLAANHAWDAQQTILDIRVSDPVAGRCRAALYRGEARLLSWVLQGNQVVAPAGFQGLGLFDRLDPWLVGLPGDVQEAVRLLRWSCIVAHGRQIPLSQQSDATAMPANCYTFQPERALMAERVGRIKDFSDGRERPLEPVNGA